ncbi:MAG TPA: alpha/beta hydrolase [Chitinophagaceae bacterium]|nr:alpha/beta hydrolase [Chitinophagaceae bacterium]
MEKLIAILFVHVLLYGPLSAQLTIALYDKIPNSKPTINTETAETTNGILRIKDVSVPTITMYKAEPPSAKRTAVIICPGGGYGILAASHEGSDVAQVFNSWGITAFVLKYRLPDDSIMVNKETGPLQDAQRALQLVRQNANQWGIDPGKIGIMGFSAGGHLAATASTHFNKLAIDNPDNISLRPDFSLLIYPVISFTDSLTHMGSRNNLIGKNPLPEKVKEYSNELLVNGQTPPAFLVHASDDKAVKQENSIQYYNALQKNKIPAALHLFPEGGHGFGMNNKTTTDNWIDRLKNWLKTNQYL